MRTTNPKTRCLAILLTMFAACSQTPPAGPPVIPKTWIDEEMKTLEVPLVEPSYSPVYVTADYYYRIPELRIVQSYPVYHPDREPPGYMDKLTSMKPELAFDPSALKTEEDWIRAGELVFDFGGPDPAFLRNVRDREWYKATGMPLASDGTVPFFRYLVQDGKVAVSQFSCGMCHTRVMPDGSVIKGAQGNLPAGRMAAFDARNAAAFTEEDRVFARLLYLAPWRRAEFEKELDRVFNPALARDEIAPAGGIARHGTSPLYPAQVPDLIGVKDRKYLDHTGLQLHRSIVDMMRYAALNQGMSGLSRYGDFTPATLPTDGKVPEPSMNLRYSDEQLFALAKFLYSLQPPKNPNPFDERARRGQNVFDEQGCPRCHTPPLYTNNKLTPVQGFEIPDDHRTKYDVMDVSVGTDPNLSLKTRRATGYYKVPSLKGVWYRGPFEHSGSVATLEDWFDPNRLRSDYVPTGFKGADGKRRGVPGHPFGLSLTPEEKADLIAFLKTL
jgi:hypothetical protein